MRKLTLLSTGLVLSLILLPMLVFAQKDVLQYYRPYDKDGVTMFEAPAATDVEFNGFEVVWGAGFTQQFQSLDHTTSASTGLSEIGAGFNLATANLNLDAQLANGIRVNLTTYLSSRHHPEAWVKGGYLQVDKLEMLGLPAVDNLMQYVTIRAGHFEINYGDAHFRRSDNGHAMHNPFVGNYILDSFTTEIGGEVYFQSNGFLAMAAMTGGELSGGVGSPDERAPSIYGKLGFDRQLGPELRVRLTGSAYTTSSSLANHLHSGDRAGSRYYAVMDGGDWSGRIRSGFGDDVQAFMINPFVQLRGLEIFGTIEQVTGGTGTGTDESIDQYALEGIYRFLDDNLYVGARYNYMKGALDLAGYGQPANWVSGLTVDRWQFGAGWFVTEDVLLKGEYVTQSYDGFPTSDVRNGGSFDGFIMEGVISF